jgi:transposase
MLKLPSLGELDAGPGVRIYLCTSPTDMRKGFDSLAALVRESLGYDPLSKHLFLFAGRGKDRLKILYWDTDGFAIWYKRLEEGTFRLPTPKVDTTKKGASTGASVELKASELAMLLAGIDLTSIKRRKRFVATA